MRERESDLAGWDVELPDKFRREWLNLSKEMFDLENLKFNRSLVPKGYDKSTKATLVMFSDGSDKGQCVVAYLVWKKENNKENLVSLVTSRTKIASMTKMTTPRSELNVAQLQARLKTWLHNNLDLELGDTVHIVDASIILGMIRNISLKFDTYTAPRVSEIQTSTEIEKWFWVDTKDNPSDLWDQGQGCYQGLGDGEYVERRPCLAEVPQRSVAIEVRLQET